MQQFNFIREAEINFKPSYTYNSKPGNDGKFIVEQRSTSKDRPLSYTDRVFYSTNINDSSVMDIKTSNYHSGSSKVLLTDHLYVMVDFSVQFHENLRII